MQLYQIEYHRNGISGEGFWAVLFLDPSVQRGRGQPYNMLATVFPEPGHVSVINTHLLAEHGVTFGPNSWRGDHYEGQLRAWIKEREDAL